MQLDKAVSVFLSEYKATTAASYRYPLIDMINYVGPARPVDKIKVIDLVEYIQSVEGRESVKSPHTVNKYIKTIRTFFNWCVRIDLIERSPATPGLKPRNAKKLVDRDKSIKDGELERLLQYTQFKPRLHSLILFFADTGCRRGGAARLRWKDIDFDNLRATVTEKGDNSRRVYFGKATAKALMLWKLEQPSGDGYVFGLNGRKMTPASVAQLVRRICNKVGIRSLGPHSFRHRKGHQLADAKTPLPVASRALGHLDQMTTAEYYFPDNDERVEDAVRSLSIKMPSPRIVNMSDRETG